jgi:glucokinase
MILAGDVGGTKTELAVFDARGGELGDRVRVVGVLAPAHGERVVF